MTRRQRSKRPHRHRQRALSVSDQAVWIAARDGGYYCAYCGVNIKRRYTIDHVHPKSKAASYPGGHVAELANLVLACKRCNRAKGDKLLGRGWTPPKERQTRDREHGRG
ncbi:MAG: HNH endonuclease [Acidimicrobiia bacterium]|nr:HNH endonuclease [Acidimicrobiia bacterium]